MIEVGSFLVHLSAAAIAAVVFFWLARRETQRTAALVERMTEDFHNQIEEQIRRFGMPASARSQLPLPDDAVRQAKMKAATPVGQDGFLNSTAPPS